jgi:hypothetical protein
VAIVTVVEDLLLLCTSDTSGRLMESAHKVDLALGGALLLELALLGKVDLTGPADEGKAGRVILRDTSPTGDEVLDAALDLLSTRQGKKPGAVIQPLSKNLRPALYRRLASHGVIRSEGSKILGVLPRLSWRIQDPQRKAAVREQVSEALLRLAPGEPRVGGLVALLHTLNLEHKVVDYRGFDLSKRELRSRAAQIAQGNWAPEAVRQAIKETTAAIAVAVAGAAAAGAVGSSGSSG